MMKFIKIYESENKVVYKIIPESIYGTVEFIKKSKEIKCFSSDGTEYQSSSIRIAFSYVFEAGLPEEYIHATN